MMAESSSKCSVGIAKEESCHKLCYIKQIGLLNFDQLESVEKSIIRKRCGIEEPIETICYHQTFASCKISTLSIYLL